MSMEENLEESQFDMPLSPPPKLPEIHSLLHQAGMVEMKLGEIDVIIGDIWQKERKCYQELHISQRSHMLKRLLELSKKAAEMQQVFIDLKKTQKGSRLYDLPNQSPEESEKAAYMKYAYFRLLLKFQESSALTDLSDSFDEFLLDLNKEIDVNQFEQLEKASAIKSRRRANSEDYSRAPASFENFLPESRNNTTLFESLYNDFTKELKQVADLDKKLKESELRLRSRDEYLQNTIIETARRTHSLEQAVAELQSEKEDLLTELSTMKPMQPSSSPRLRTPNVTTITAQEIKEEQEVDMWIMESNGQESGRETVHVDEGDNNEEIMALAQTLTTLAEEKELLESDLCIVRLQVEHLEAISRERDVVLNELLRKRRENQLKVPQPSTRISRMFKAY